MNHTINPLPMALLLTVAAMPLAVTAASAIENLALGKPYTLEPSPNYAHCTDPGDLLQLTDGQYTAGFFWTQPSTVGWAQAHPVIITIDLGSVQPIGGVSFNTAANAAGAGWPSAITILVTDDGKAFFVAGELTQLSARRTTPPRDGYAIHRFTTDQLQTHARFVKLLITPPGRYCFTDEVEIFKGKPEFMKVSHAGQAITDVKAFFHSNEIRMASERRIRNDARAVYEAVNWLGISAEAKRKMVDELDGVERGIPNLPPQQPDNFRTVLPLNALHERVYQVQARLWREQGLAPLTVWQSDLWSPLPHVISSDVPTLNPRNSSRRAARVDVAMMQNEYRAGSFNLSWTGEHPTSVRAKIVGLPGGVNPAYVTVHEVAWTDTKKGMPVAAALPFAEREADSFIIRVSSGLTRQVWLTFHPTNIPAGVHKGSIHLTAAGTKFKIPLRLHLYTLRFPDQPTLHVGGWDYTDQESYYDITPQNREAVIAHLREHFVDSPWATPKVLPHGRYDGKGNLVETPDTASFDRWLQRWPGARQYCIYAAVKDDCAGSPMGTPTFDRKVGEWIRFWAGHAQRRGVKPEQLVLLLVDEPTEPEKDKIILAWARAIRAANTGVKIWEDPCHEDPAAANQEMMRACHVLCPNRPAFLKAGPGYREYYVKQREQGSELAFYSCSGLIQSLDPYTYYRLQPWTCWEFGARASYFWAFGDAGGRSSWNEYSTWRGGFVPFFLDANSATPGKHMEALREGVEDYEYLVMLKTRTAALEGSGVRNARLDCARRLLDRAVEQVCHAEGADDFSWAHKKNRTLADEIRREILELLSESPFAERAARKPAGGKR